ncbi:PP2C family serine/threonine-protein phosphatase [Azospirillum canadense]|uniref:PP2C family serine/threonine-protein phosphatase n=1 Tax=Azospirillum canadense TaxID=403962 RepID=UPI002227EC26|nr:PP2C family serine/threonine-protein phosphatase [Azospirillum canadense]
MSLSWRSVSTSAAGTSHLRDGRPCQDASVCVTLLDDEGCETLVAVVSDGAGSAAHSDIGSGLACSLFVDELRALLETGGSVADVTPDFTRDWLRRFSAEIAVRAEAMECSPRELACTLLGAVVSESRAVFLQVGDGAIVFSTAQEPDAMEVAVWPQQGEFANVTFFATDLTAGDRIAHRAVEERIDRLAMFSDGLQMLALSFADRSAFRPFFDPLFGTLEGAPEDAVANLSDPLEEFLSSPRVNGRTDDDKSLILASRRQPPNVIGCGGRDAEAVGP